MTAAASRPLVLIYRIDAGGRISRVNAAWTEFARDNGGEALMPERVLGRDLLQAMTDSTVRALYAQMIRQARDGRAVRFRYRCDAPDRRRIFEMEIRAVGGGEVEFVSTLRHEEPRAPVGLLQGGQARDARLLRVCSWCQQVAVGEHTWLPVEAAAELMHLLEAETFPRLTHGICDACRAKWDQADGAGPVS